MTTTRPRSTAAEVRAAIDSERAYQDAVWPPETPGSSVRSIGHFLSLLRVEARKADDAYAEHVGDQETLIRLRKIGALAIQGLEIYGHVWVNQGETRREAAYRIAKHYGASSVEEHRIRMSVGDALCVLWGHIGDSLIIKEEYRVANLARIAWVAMVAIEEYGAIARQVPAKEATHADQ